MIMKVQSPKANLTASEMVIEQSFVQFCNVEHIRLEEIPRFFTGVLPTQAQRHKPTTDQHPKTFPHENRIFGPQFQSEPTCA